MGLSVALVAHAPGLRPGLVQLGPQPHQQLAREGRGPAGEGVVGGGGGGGHGGLLTRRPEPYLDRPMSMTYELSHLRTLEAEAIHIIREVAAEFERPGLLFSGGKDSIVMLHLAVKAFHPGRVPFPVMHVDTGHNFAEVLEFRDVMVERVGARLVVASVQDDIDAGRTVEDERASGQPQPAPDRHPPARHRGEPVRRRLRGGPARRGEGPGQGAGLQLP